VSILGAYAIARHEFLGRRQVHYLFLAVYLFLVENRQNWTVSLGLSQLAGSIEVSKTTQMAGSAILTLPIIVLSSPPNASWSRASPAAPRRADPTVRRRTVRPGWCR
jgi:ABC-type glycerol-3-phosphate transport system permease component